MFKVDIYLETQYINKSPKISWVWIFGEILTKLGFFWPNKVNVVKRISETWPDLDFWLGQDKYFEAYNFSQQDYKSKAVIHIKELAMFGPKLNDIIKKMTETWADPAFWLGPIKFGLVWPSPKIWIW